MIFKASTQSMVSLEFNDYTVDRTDGYSLKPFLIITYCIQNFCIHFISVNLVDNHEHVVSWTHLSWVKRKVCLLIFGRQF